MRSPDSCSECRDTAATPAAPAGSTSTPIESAISVIAAWISWSSTMTISSASSMIRARDSGIGTVIASAPAMVPVPAFEIGRRAAKLRAIAGAPLAHTPATLGKAVRARGGMLPSSGFGALVRFNPGPECPHALDLAGRRVRADEDVRRRFPLASRIGESLPEVARGGAHPDALGIQLPRQHAGTPAP
jgi:hypothetical protein